jgi:hypothetical protein
MSQQVPASEEPWVDPVSNFPQVLCSQGVTLVRVAIRNTERNDL